MGNSLFILGGSSPYTLLLLRAIAHQDFAERLDGITLFGRDVARLSFVTRRGEDLMREAGVTIRIDATTDFASCLDECYGILFNQVRIGGMAARDRDEKTALAVGLPADETLGMVGVSNAIRAIRGLQPYLDVLRHKRGDFLIINFTNPCSLITQWIAEVYGFNVIGVCDYPAYFCARLAAFFSVAPGEVDMHYFGLNHCAFVHDIRIAGRSVLAEMLMRLSDFPLGLPFQQPFPYLFVPGWEQVFQREVVHARQGAEPNNRAAALLAIEQTFAELVSHRGDIAAALDLLAQRHCTWYELAVVPLLQQCLSADDGTAIVNGDAGDVFRLGRAVCVVESNALVGRYGARVAELPAAVHHTAQFDVCRLLKRAELSLLDGVLTTDRDAVLAACLLNPMIQCFDRTRRYLRALAQHDPDIAPFAPD